MSRLLFPPRLNQSLFKASKSHFLSSSSSSLSLSHLNTLSSNNQNFLNSQLFSFNNNNLLQRRTFLRPDTTKKHFLKDRKGRLQQKETKAHTVQFGDYGIKSLEPARICNHQIEAAVRTMRRLLSKQGM